jgi:hypothetical protein
VALGERVARSAATLVVLETFLRSIDDRTPVQPLLPRPQPSPRPPAALAAAAARAPEAATAGAGERPGPPLVPGAAPSPSGLEAVGKATLIGTGVAARKYKPVNNGTGFQTVKTKDALADLGGPTAGQEAAQKGGSSAAGSPGSGSPGSGLRGVVFVQGPEAAREGPFAPDTAGDASLTLTNAQTGQTFKKNDAPTLATDPESRLEFNYEFTDLPPGPYHATVTKPGFAVRTTATPLSLEPGRALDVDVFLEVQR